MGLVDNVFSTFSGVLGGEGEQVSKNWKIAAIVLLVVAAALFLVLFVLYVTNRTGFVGGRNAGGCANCARAQGARMQAVEWPASAYDDMMASKEFYDSTGMVRIQDNYNAVLPDNIKYGFTGYKMHQFEPEQEKTPIRQKMPSTNIMAPKWGESDMLNLLDS